MSMNNQKHASTMKMIAQITGQLVTDLELLLQEVEQDSFDTGYDAGYAKCKQDYGLNKDETRKIIT
jgi:UTP-glucose-1-phosphate uridylyltransferase